MTIDHSVTVSEALPILKLVDRTERLADPRDARELAQRVKEAVKRPDRRVAEAFRIDPSRARRDRIIRDLAGEGSLRQQAEAIRKKVCHYRPHPADRGATGERGLLWELHQMGSLDLCERQVRRILGGR